MKKTITLMLGLLGLGLNAQNVTDFESYTLTTNSFYNDTNSTSFQSTSAIFRYSWDKQFDFWSGGFAYTNKNDTVNGDYMNVYNCRAFKGYNNSAKYATGQDRAVIVMKAPYDQLDGMYITNTNYDYKSMKNGDQFAKKFGGTTGNDPDWFKVTAKGYFNGAMKTDSAEFYLADYRFTNNASDYIVQNWQWFNTSILGEVDSVQFFMYSSDVGQFGINTPLFFSIDNVTIRDNFVGITMNELSAGVNIYPNPFLNQVNISTGIDKNLLVNVYDIAGKQLISLSLLTRQNTLDLSNLAPGVYFCELSNGRETVRKKLVKN